MAIFEPLHYSGSQRTTGWITNSQVGTKFTNTLGKTITITAINVYCKGPLGNYHSGWLGKNTLKVSEFIHSAKTTVSSSFGWTTFTLPTPVKILANGVFYAGIVSSSTSKTYISRYINSTGNTYYLASPSTTTGTLVSDPDALGSTATPWITVTYLDDDVILPDPEEPGATGELEPLYYSSDSIVNTGWIASGMLGTKFINNFNYPILVTDVNICCYTTSGGADYRCWFGNNTLQNNQFVYSANPTTIPSSMNWITIPLNPDSSLAQTRRVEPGGVFYAGLRSNYPHDETNFIRRWSNSAGNCYWSGTNSMTSSTSLTYVHEKGNHAALGTPSTPWITVNYEALFTHPEIETISLGASGTTLNMSWSGIDGTFNSIQSYDIKIYQSDGTLVSSHTTDANTTTYSYAASRGQSYYFTVEAIGENSNSELSTSNTISISPNVLFIYKNGEWKEIHSVSLSENLNETYIWLNDNWKKMT